MHAFLSRFSQVVRGVLNGLDRICFRGTLRNLAYAKGLQHYLWHSGVRYKDFAAHSQAVTAQLEEASLRQARELGREIRYLNTSQVRKEDVAREIAARDRIDSGLICVLRSVDPCLSFEIRKNGATKRLEIKYRERKCLHLYHYQIHPIFGFMHARIQTWFPFRIYVCLNGREWLARQMDQAGLRYRRHDNSFTWLKDLPQAQALLDQQLQVHWPNLLDGLAHSLNPNHADIFAHYPTRYYWSVEQSEWASDVMFRSREELEALYPRFVRHALTTYGAVDVLRFLGRQLRSGARVPRRFAGEVLSNLKCREEGVRVKHWLNYNSVKLYDKGSVLRCECTIQNPEDFRVYRPKEGDPEGAKDWRPLRLRVADLYRRAEVSQAATTRYLDALAAVADATPVRQLAEPLCRPVPAPRTHRQHRADLPATPAPTPADPTVPTPRRRVRALNPLAADDAALLQAVSRPEFTINGLRNRDLRAILFPQEPASPTDARRQSGKVTRLLRLLRAHGLIQKVPKTHRYLVSPNGRTTITALLAARNANADFLTTNAA